MSLVEGDLKKIFADFNTAIDAAPVPDKEKLASKLSWLEKKQKDPAVRDLRKQARIIPESPHSTLTFAETTSAVNGTGKGKAVGKIDWAFKGHHALR